MSITLVQVTGQARPGRVVGAVVALAAGWFAAVGGAAAADIDPPLHPDEAAIVRGIIESQETSLEAAELPAKAAAGIVARLQPPSVDPQGLKAWRVHHADRPTSFLTFVSNADGRVVSIQGNGPWLRDEHLRAMRGMPELRAISVDHNGHLRGHPQAGLYSGAGFDALADSKITDVRLTLGLDDAGLEKLVGIRSLAALQIIHCKVTEDGLRVLEGHPALETITVAQMGTVSQQALASIAKMPKVKRVRFGESFVTYDEGLALLAPLKDRLTELDLSMTVVNDADLERFQAEFPGVAVKTMPAEEIVKRHIGVARALARIATGAAGEKLKQALADAPQKAAAQQK